MIPAYRYGLCGLLLACTAVQAEAPPVPLSLPVVLDQTLRHHPQLSRIGVRRRQLQSELSLAQRPPPLDVALQMENVGEQTDQFLETTLSLGGVLQWGHRAEARLDVARQRNAAVELEMRQHTGDILAAAASRFIDLAAAEAERAQARRERELADQISDATSKRKTAGAASPADLARAELAVARARLKQQSAEARVESARHALAIAMAAPEPLRGPVIASLGDLSPLPTADELMQLAEAAPATQLVNARLRIARSQWRLAQHRATPDLDWRVGLRDQRDRDTQSLVAELSLPLAHKRRTQAERDHAAAAIELAGHDRELARLELQALLLQAWQSLSELRRHAVVLDQTLIPRGETVVRELQAGYRRGRYGLLDLMSAQRELHELLALRLDARVRYHQGRIELERLLGRSLQPETRS